MARPKKTDESASDRFSGRLLVQTTDGYEKNIFGFLTVEKELTELGVLAEFQKTHPTATVQGLEIKRIK